MTKLGTILDQVDSGTMLLPEFQRGYVWNREQVRELMRSLFRGYPVGSLLVWETETNPGAVRGGVAPGAGVRMLLLDGQQRITTLYGIVRGRAPAFFEGRAESFTGLRFHLKTESFEFYAPAKMTNDPYWVDVSGVFAPDGLERAVAALVAGGVENAEALSLMLKLSKLRNILEREFHQEKITGADVTYDVVVDIFNKVNSGGTKLSKGDLALARICAEDPRIRGRMRNLLDRWAAWHYNFSLDWLLRNVNAVVTGRAPFSALEGVSSTAVADGLERSARHVEVVLQTFQGRLGLDHNRVLMGRGAVPVISRLLDKSGGAFGTARERDRVLYWYIHAALWGRFAGSTETVLQQDIEALDQGGTDGLIAALERWRGGNLTLEPYDFESYGVGSRFYPLLYLMTRVLEARDLGTGIPLKAEMLGPLAGLQVHHIFPKAYLYEHGFDRASVNTVANFAFLTQNTNLQIGRKDPAEYLAEVAERQPGALESQWIPTNPDLWHADRYDDFVVARQELLVSAANSFLAELRDGRSEDTPDLRALPAAFVAETDDRAESIAAAVAGLEALGFASPERDSEVADPETGEVLAVAEAWWPAGLQPGLDVPVVLELDPKNANLPRLEELGYRVFITTDALLGFAMRQVEVESSEDGSA
ncbi:DUF262 domain-containing protein [Cellulomonas sp. A375-1]|uniref:DUF262 domain-containing protein n=1 Tax=Cellulomonas sp. A375-1 TaxID=1672219 RepID=UPI00069CEC0B|nr:DUF262 domain-containing protein [Cellulomonas sp. A375-1]